MKPIVISFSKKTSQRDIDNLKDLLGIIREQYNCDWFIDTYADEKDLEKKPEPLTNRQIENIVYVLKQLGTDWTEEIEKLEAKKTK